MTIDARLTPKLGGCICVKVKCTGWPRDLVFTFHLARSLTDTGRTREGLGRCPGVCGERERTAIMSVVMLSDSDMSVAGGDGEVDCSIARPPPPLHAHPPPTIGLDGDVMGVTGSSGGGCDVERVSPSQVTAVSSDTHSSSPDTQTGKLNLTCKH